MWELATLFPSTSRLKFVASITADKSSIVSGVMLISLPFTAQGALLFAIYLGGWGTPAFVLALSWCSETNAGHTKKTTTNAMLLIGYCELLVHCLVGCT